MLKTLTAQSPFVEQSVPPTVELSLSSQLPDKNLENRPYYPHTLLIYIHFQIKS